MYLTYDEYRNYGGTETETAFILLEFKARKRIDYVTAGRVMKMAQVPEAVKLCMMSVVNMINAAGEEKQATNPVATSFSTDGYSESYGNALSSDSFSAAVNKLIASMLYGELDDNGVPLCYRGVIYEALC